MKAVRYHSAGDPTVLKLEDIDKPSPKPNEVLVAVKAASINPTDAKRRRNGAGPMPKTTGSDFAGIVEAVGETVTEFQAGDRVCGSGLHTTRFHQGSFAEYVSVPKDIVTSLPDSISYESGAAVALVGITAWRALIDHAKLHPAEVCMIHGGTGGVGHIAVQLSTLLGAKTIATVGSDTAETIASELGADIVLRYQSESLIEDIRDEVPAGCNVILDHRVHDYFGVDIEISSFGARIVHIGGLDQRVDSPRQGRNKNIRMHMMSMSNLVLHDELPSIASVLDRVLRLVETGKLTPIIDRSYSLEEASEIHRSVLEDSFIGKLVVEI